MFNIDYVSFMKGDEGNVSLSREFAILTNVYELLDPSTFLIKDTFCE